MKTLKLLAILLITSLAGAFFARADIFTSLQGAWNVSDGPTSSTVHDSSINADNGTLTGFADTTFNNMWTATTDPINLDPYAVTFNTGGGTNAAFGTNTYVSVPDVAPLDLPAASTHAYTVAAWVYCNVPGYLEASNAGIVCKGFLGTGEAYDIYMTEGRFTSIQHNSAGSGVNTVNGNFVAASNTWYHVVASFSSGRNPELYLYVDGVSNSVSQLNTYTTLFNSTLPLTIGCRDINSSGTIGFPFQGIVDQVRVYSRTLSASDIMQLYQNGQYWDPSSSVSGTGSGGSGSWDSSTMAWWIGGGADTNWTIGTAYFEGSSAGTVTLNANETASGLLFTVPGYTINQGSGSPVLTLGGGMLVPGAGTIAVPDGTTTINCPIAGISGMAASGIGKLILGGENTYTGITTISNGVVLNLGSAENAGTSGPLGDSAASNPGSIVMAGGTLQYSAVNQNDYSGRFSTAPGQDYNIDVNGQSVTFGTALYSTGSILTLRDSVGGGALNLQSSTVASNIMVTGGTLELNSSTALSSGAIVTLPQTPGANPSMNLNFSGTQNVSALNFGTVSEPTGTYGSSTSGATYQSAYFTGNGVLNVTGSGANLSYWDPGLNASYPGSGGTGSWDSSTADWFTGSGDAIWLAGTIANFAGTNGSVTLNASETADGITFYSPNYTINEGSSGSPVLTMGGSAPPTIFVPGGGSDTINCILAGGGIIFEGPGTLALGGTNTFASALIPQGGTVLVNNGSAAGGSSTTIIDNGTLNVNIASGTLSSAITGNGTVNIIETPNDNLGIGGSMSGFTGTLNCPGDPGGTAKAQILTTAVSINAGATVNVANYGTLYIASAGVTIPCAVNLYGVGNYETYGALRIESGAGVSGPVTLYGNTTIGGGSGVGTISGAIGDGGNGYGITKTVNAGSLALSGINTYSGPTTINGGVFAISGAGELGSGSYAGNIANNAFFVYSSSATQTLSGLITGSGGITNNGPGTLILTDAGNANSGNITLNGGILDVPSQHPIGDGLSSSSLVFNGGTLENDDATAGDGFALSYGVVLNAGGGILSTPTAGQSLIVGNPITGTGSLTKIGSGAITLTNVDAYSGSTIITAGTLALSGVGSIANTPKIIVAGGAAFDVSALSSVFVLGASQTISNSASTATIAGNLNTGSGSLSLTYAAGMPSLLVTNGTVTLSAGTVVNINNTGSALPIGVYNIVTNASGGNAGTVAGTLPPVTVTGGGIAVGATASLQINGGALELVVASATPPAPRITTISLSGTTLNITATNGAQGGQYTLLGSTNLLLPLNQWIPILTNMFDGSGDLTLSTNIINPGIPYEFYILVQP